MRATFWFPFLACALVTTPLRAQEGGEVLFHAGTLVELDTEAGNFEGAVIQVTPDSVRVRSTGDPASSGMVTVPRSAIRSARIRQSIPVWAYTASIPVMWELFENAGLARPGATLLLADDREVFAIDVYSGELAWSVPIADAFSQEPEEVIGFAAVEEDSLVLLIGKSKDGIALVTAIGASTGTTKWQVDEEFTRPPSELAEYPVLALPGSGRLLVYVNRDGPFLVDGSDGSIVWQGRSLFGRPVPDPGSGAAIPVAEDSVIYVPTERGVAALALSDGRRLWETWDDEQFMPNRIRPTALGLLVMGWDIDRSMSTGGVQFSLLDPASGDVLWDIRPEGVQRSLLRTDSLFVAGAESIEAIDLASGEVRHVARWRKPTNVGKFRMELEGFSMDSRGYYLGWTFGSITLDTLGRERSRIKLDPPGANLGETLAAGLVGLPWIRRSGSGVPGTWYVYTGEPLAPDVTGFSIARIDQRAGKVSGRVWLDERRPDFRVVPGLALVARSGSDVVEFAAFAFTGCETLHHAAASGSSALVDSLLVRGLGPADDMHDACDPVLAAAAAGQSDIVAQLLAAGWDASESSPSGWLPIHHAAWQGDLELVSLLLGEDTPASAATRGSYPWTPLLLAMLQDHDSTVEALEARGATADSSAVHLMKSWSHLRKGDPARAESEREVALESSPALRYPPRYRALFCYRYAENGLSSPWPDDCDREIADNGRDPFAHFARGYARGIAGDAAGATADFLACVRLDPFGTLAEACLYSAEPQSQGAAAVPIDEAILDQAGPDLEGPMTK